MQLNGCVVVFNDLLKKSACLIPLTKKEEEKATARSGVEKWVTCPKKLSQQQYGEGEKTEDKNNWCPLHSETEGHAARDAVALG